MTRTRGTRHVALVVAGALLLAVASFGAAAANEDVDYLTDALPGAMSSSVEDRVAFHEAQAAHLANAASNNITCDIKELVNNGVPETDLPLVTVRGQALGSVEFVCFSFTVMSYPVHGEGWFEWFDNTQPPDEEWTEIVPTRVTCSLPATMGVGNVPCVNHEEFEAGSDFKNKLLRACFELIKPEGSASELERFCSLPFLVLDKFAFVPPLDDL